MPRIRCFSPTLNFALGSLEGYTAQRLREVVNRAQFDVRFNSGATEASMALEIAAKLSEIPAGSIKTIQVGGKTLALANVAGTLYAIDNTCLHRGGPLGEGELAGTVVTCPWHGWQFDVTTGKAVQNPSAGVGCFKTEVRGDEVFVDLG